MLWQTPFSLAGFELQRFIVFWFLFLKGIPVD